MGKLGRLHDDRNAQNCCVPKRRTNDILHAPQESFNDKNGRDECANVWRVEKTKQKRNIVIRKLSSTEQQTFNSNTLEFRL